MSLLRAVVSVVLVCIATGNTASWEKIGGPSGGSLRQITHVGSYLFGAYSDLTYQTGVFQRLFRCDLNDGVWVEIERPDSLALFSLAATYGSRIYLSYLSTAFSDDYGVSWKYLPGVAFKSNILNVHDTLYVGTAAGLYRSADMGTSWEHTSADRTPLYSLTYSNGAFLSLSSKGVLISKDIGQTWETIKSGIPFNSSGNVSFFHRKAIVAAGEVIYAKNRYINRWITVIHGRI
jgi:hypothetical protein